MAELEDLIYSGLISPRAAGRNGFEMPSAASASLGQTMPPEPVQEAIKGMAEPVTSAGWLLGGAMQGSQRPSTMDIIKAAGGLGLAAMPMGPGRASMLARGLETAADTAPTAIRAYHGSPYDFPAFDISKIGTGEGAQAYGHGLYFAEQEATARAYKKNLAPAAADVAPSYRGGGEWQVTTREGDTHNREFFPTKEEAQAFASKYDKGHMYEVNIKAHPEQFLDWDKPLSQQSQHVQDAFGKVVDRNLADEPGWSKLTGEEALRAAVERGGVRGGGEAALYEAGIPGIRYLDQGSRNAGNWKITPPDQTVSGKWMVKSSDYNSKGMHFDTEAEANKALQDKIGGQTHNYVVFNDKLIDIIKKYGLAGLIGAGAYHGQLPAKQGGT